MKVKLLIYLILLLPNNLFSQLQRICYSPDEEVFFSCERIGKFTFDPIKYETANCSIFDSVQIVLTNTSKNDLIINSINLKNQNSGYSVAQSIKYPLIVKSGKKYSIFILLKSVNRKGLIDDTLDIVSNARVSTSFGIGIDESTNMFNPMNCQTIPNDKLSLAKKYISDFISRYIFNKPIEKVNDELLMLVYSTKYLGDILNNISPNTKPLYGPIKINQQKFLTDAISSMNTISPANKERMAGWAIRELTQGIKKSNLKNRLSILYVSGDPDISEINAGSKIVLNNAFLYNVRVFIIADNLTNVGRDYYNDISLNSKGKLFEINNCNELQCVIDSIAELSNFGGTTELPLSIKINKSELSSKEFQFDTVKVGTDFCKSFVINNNDSSGNLTVTNTIVKDKFNKVSNVFRSNQPKPPFIVNEGKGYPVTICFLPDNLGFNEGYVYYNYNSCDNQELKVKVSGYGISSLNVMLNDTVYGSNGDYFYINVYADSTLSNYNVNDLNFNIKYDKRLLNLEYVISGNDSKSTIYNIVENLFDNNNAISKVIGKSSTIINKGEFARLKFKVLYGTPESSTIELTSGSFSNGFLKMNSIGKGLFVIKDNGCFPDSKKIINKNDLQNVFLVKISENPIYGNGNEFIELYLKRNTIVSVTIENSLVSYSECLFEGELISGINQIPLKPNLFSSGMYYLIVKSVENSNPIIKKIIFLK